MGLCFGVRDALRAAETQAHPDQVTIHGELVHNPQVLGNLRARGFAMTAGPAQGEMPSTDNVLVTAHGISDVERARLRRAGKHLIDTTCPLVAKAHDAALQLARECDLVLVIGKPNHVEVSGLTGDLPSSEVVPHAEDVRTYPVRSIGVLCQTTFPVHRAQEILRAIELRNPDATVRFADTICEPTKQRIRAIEELVALTEVVVVVGGANSNNTKELVRMCEDAGARAHHVQGPEDIRAEWLHGQHTVGLTAGTSTPDDVVEAVYEALANASTKRPTSSSVL